MRDPIALAQANNYVAFMEAWKKHWPKDEWAGMATLRLYNMLTNEGENPFQQLDETESTMIVFSPSETNWGETNIGRNALLSKVASLPEEQLVKVLSFPYELPAGTANASDNSSSGWDISLHRIISREKENPAYAGLILHVLGEEDPQNVKIRFFSPERIQWILDNAENENWWSDLLLPDYWEKK